MSGQIEVNRKVVNPREGISISFLYLQTSLCLKVDTHMYVHVHPHRHRQKDRQRDRDTHFMMFLGQPGSISGKAVEFWQPCQWKILGHVHKSERWDGF
jgi:hypothetical protein